MTYMCKDCFTNYCKLPYFCKFCNSLLVNEILLSQIRESKSDIEYDNKFINLQKFFILFYCYRLNENKFDHILNKFLQKLKNFLINLQKKDSK
jgi:hypothetical protein